MSPEELDALLSGIKVEPVAPGTAPVPGPLEALPVVQPVDLGEEQRSFERHMADYWRPTTGEPEASVRARQLAAGIRLQPQPVGERPTLQEQAGISFTPHRTGADARPLPANLESAVRAAGFTGDLLGAAGLPLPRGATEEVARSAATLESSIGSSLLDVADRLGVESAGQLRRWMTQQALLPDDQGVPEETDLLAALRILGTAVPATIIETVSRAPLPTKRGLEQNASAALNALAEGEGIAKAAHQLFTVRTLGEQVGAAPGFNQRVRRTDEGVFRDWMQGVLERIERGDSLEVDAASAFRQLGTEPVPLGLGENNPLPETVGWWMGLAIDTVANWETLAAKVPRGILRTAQRVERLGELAPKTSKLERMMRAVADHEIPIHEWLADQAWQHVTDGGSIDDLPARWRARADDVSLNEYGMTAGELGELEGRGARQAPAGAGLSAPDEYAAAQAKATTTQAAVVDPGTGEKLYVPEAAMKRSGEPKQTWKRPPLPPFQNPDRIHTAVDWWDAAADHYRPGAYPPGGYNIARHEGYRRIVDGIDQQPDVPRYVLLNKERDVIATGSMYHVANVMLDRAKAEGKFLGDELWFDVVRPVARWGVLDSGAIGWRSDRLFASPVERRVIQLARQSDPRAIPVRLQQLAAEQVKAAAAGSKTAARKIAAADPKKIHRQAGRLILDQITASPGIRDPNSRLYDVLTKAAQLEARDMLGSEQLRILPGGGMVPAGEWRSIMDRANERLGIKPERLREILRGQTPDPEELAKLRDLGRRAGVPAQAIDAQMTPDGLLRGFVSPAALLQIHRQAVQEVAGIFADARYRVRAMPKFHEQLFSTLKLATQERTRWSDLGNTLVRGRFSPVQALSRWLFEDPLHGVDPKIASELVRLRTAVERNADDLAHEFQRAEGSPVAKMVQIAGRYAQVIPEEVRLARTVRENTTLHNLALKTDADALKTGRSAVTPDQRAEDLLAVQLGLRPAFVRAWHGELPVWANHQDPEVFVRGLEAWSRRTIKDAAESGRRWLEAVASVTGEYKNFGLSLLREQIAKVPDELAAKVYDEVFGAGALHGTATKDALAGAGYKVDEINARDALLVHAMNLRLDWLVTDGMDRLTAVGGVVRAGDPRTSALSAMALGQDKEWNAAARAWQYKHSEAQTVWARQQLDRWGYDPGAQGGQLSGRMKLGRREVVVPMQLGEVMQRYIDHGMVDSRALTKNAGYNSLMRYYKEWTTHGIGLPNPGYFTGQMLSMAPMLLTTQGLAGTARTAATIARHPVLVGELMRRMQGAHPSFVADLLQPTLMTEAKVPVHLDELVRVAKEYGLGDSQTAFEVGRSFAEVVARDGSDYRLLDPRKIGLSERGRRLKNGATYAASTWQQAIRDFAGSFDQAARLGVYVEKVRQGMPLEQAALEARKAVLDFRDLTEAEKKYGRAIFTFYAFLRKNADAHTLALLENPSRVLGQFRLAHASLTEPAHTLLNEIEQGQLDDNDLARLVIYQTDNVYSRGGRPNTRYRTNSLQSPPIGASEYLMLCRMLGLVGLTGSALDLAGLDRGMPLAGYKVDPDPLVSATVPAIQIPAILLLSAVPGSTPGSIDRPSANRIPPILMRGPWGAYVGRTFGVGPAELTDRDDPMIANEDASAELGFGRRGVWAAGSAPTLTPDEAHRYRAMWQAFGRFVGRPVANANQLAIVAGLSDPPPDVSWGQFTTAYMLGLSWRPRSGQATTIDQYNRGVRADFATAKRERPLQPKK